MKTLTKDARGFIEGVEKYIRSSSEKSVLPKVQSLFTKVTTQAKRERVAKIESAVALTEAEKKAIEKMLTMLLSHEVECTYAVNEDLMGGFKIQIADWIVDSSLSTQLASITKSLYQV